jgi:DNA polymerase-4
MCVPVPRHACTEKHYEIRKVLEEFAPVVEGASIDEWYLDLGGTEGVYHNEPLDTTAHRIRNAVKEATTLSISIGGGTNKLVAKLAVERAKPKPGTGANGVHIVAPGMEEEFLKTFALADIPMIGPKFQQRLASLGMVNVPDVLQYDVATLQTWFGKREAGWLWERVHGISESEVESGGEAKSISRDETFPRDISDDRELEMELVALVTRAAFDLRSEGLTARTIAVRIRDMDFRTRRAQKTLSGPVVSDRVILGVARELLAKLRKARRVPARLLSVGLSGLSQDPEADQTILFGEKKDELAETARDRVLAKTIDRVREKFGRDSVVPATLKRS